MAVPSTLITGFCLYTLIKSVSNPVNFRYWIFTNLRPLCQVIITRYIPDAINIGNQPPSGIFPMFAEKKDKSIVNKNAVTAIDMESFHFHKLFIAKKANNVVITIVVVIATP